MSLYEIRNPEAHPMIIGGEGFGRSAAEFLQDELDSHDVEQEHDPEHKVVSLDIEAERRRLLSKISIDTE